MTDDHEPEGQLLEASAEPRSIEAWTSTFQQARTLAEMLANEGNLLPDSYHKRPGNVLAALMWCRTMGIANPIAAMNHLANVKGKTSAHGPLPLAIAMAHPDYVAHDLGWAPEEHRHKKVDDLPDDFHAWFWIERRQKDGQVKRVRRTFSMGEARAAGLVRKSSSGADMPWRQYPVRMTGYRAQQWAVVDAFPDAGIGIGLEPGEEIKDAEATVLEPTEAPADVEVTQEDLSPPPEPRQGKHFKSSYAFPDERPKTAKPGDSWRDTDGNLIVAFDDPKNPGRCGGVGILAEVARKNAESVHQLLQVAKLDPEAEKVLEAALAQKAGAVLSQDAGAKPTHPGWWASEADDAERKLFRDPDVAGRVWWTPSDRTFVFDEQQWGGDVPIPDADNGALCYLVEKAEWRERTDGTWRPVAEVYGGEELRKAFLLVCRMPESLKGQEVGDPDALTELLWEHLTVEPAR